MPFFIRAYDWLKAHPKVMPLALIAVTSLLLWGASRIRFTENITDFLPLNENDKAAMEIYAQLSDADRVMVIFTAQNECADEPQIDNHSSEQMDDAAIDILLNAVDDFTQAAKSFKPVSQIDMGLYMDIIDSIYANIPYYLDETDYSRFDSLLTSHAIAASVDSDLQMLQMPLSGMAVRMIKNDPLRLFTPRIEALNQFANAFSGFDIYDGYLLTADHSMALAYITSPYGASETSHNAALSDSLQAICENIMERNPDVSIRLLGAPIIAVQNARQIKQDSTMALCLSAVLITILMLSVFRRQKKGIALILLATAFGWLCGMAALGFISGTSSLIIVGIGSTIIGIAVNYPLHLILHSHNTHDTRQNLQEEISPLVIGNITTVGAFIALLPLQATAMRDLGIFATAMLIGTIMFTTIVLPQLMKQHHETSNGTTESDNVLKLSVKQWTIILAIVLTASGAMAYLGHGLNFDCNLSNINYMTERQRADFRFFERNNMVDTTSVKVFIPYSGSTWQDASIAAHTAKYPDSITVRSITHYLPDPEEQRRRIKLWNDYWSAKGDVTLRQLTANATAKGLTPATTDRFRNLLDKRFDVQDWDSFSPMAENMFRGYFTVNQTSADAFTSRFTIVDRIEVSPHELEKIKAQYPGSFDIASLNGRIANSLADNFNYLGLVCSIIVFVFLWLSFRRFWYAIIAFLPMALSWCWIFGLMHIFGLQFNVVNIILATFIFGQGDDYTIFVVEGLIYERETGKRILPQYRREILFSAVVMLLGIGVLVLAKHPAMFSLGAVTLIGMSSVVLMAFIVPPALFSIYHAIRNRLTNTYTEK